MAQYRHPRLVGLDNRGHLTHSSQHAREARRAGIGDSGAAAASARIAVAFEEIVRVALDRVVALSDKRILAYEEAERGGGYARRYRELDAVSMDGGVAVFEIKATRSERSALRGIRQLEKTGEILQTGALGRSEGNRLVLVWVDTAGAPQREMNWSTAAAPSDLGGVLGEMPVVGRVRLMRLEARHVWQWRSELGIVGDEALWDEYQREAETADRRRALTEAGVSAADWPEELREPDRVVSRWATDTGGGAKESPLASALRRVLDGADDWQRALGRRSRITDRTGASHRLAARRGSVDRSSPR